MDETAPRMSNLFLQLGLDAGDGAIAAFIRGHQLPAGVAVADAPYWNTGQRQLLSEQLREDAEWAIVVDELNEALHEDAARPISGR